VRSRWGCGGDVRETRREFKVQSRTFLDLEAIFEGPDNFCGQGFFARIGRRSRCGAIFCHC
jgi:hypothetical protein